MGSDPMNSIHKARARKRRAAARWKAKHPHSSRLKQQRYTYLQMHLMRWARLHFPKIIRRFKHEAMRAFPACLADLDHPERGK